jgi:transposase
LQEWLSQGHLAYFISDTVDSLNLSAFHARYAGGGSRNQPFHPAMMVKVLVYAYATGVFSSRKISKRLHEDVAFRVLVLRLTLCEAIPPGFIPSLFRVFAKPSSEVAWDGPQMK